MDSVSAGRIFTTLVLGEHKLIKLPRNRKFFPPTEKDLSHHEQEEELKKGESVADQLPDPPTTEPTQEGEPTHKKAKVSHEDIDKDWEALESTGESAENGPAEEKEQKDVKEGKVTD